MLSPATLPGALLQLDEAVRKLIYSRGPRYRMVFRVCPEVTPFDLTFVQDRYAIRHLPCAGPPCLGITATGEEVAEHEWSVDFVCEHVSAEQLADRILKQAPARGAARAPVPADAEHGRVGTYSNHKCRCEQCREANNRAQRELLRRYAQSGGRDRHGTDYRYRTGCGCPECRKAHSVEDRRYREARGGR